jgi:2'-5' RNA ligase
VRCFVAIELSEEVRRRLTGLQQELDKVAKGVRWVAPEAIHLTLKFLGEVPDRRIPAFCDVVKAVAGRCRPFQFAVGSTGCFPSHGSVRVIWVALEETSGELIRCQQLCEGAFAELGFAREDRPFIPHLTLGRVKDPRQAGGLRDVLAAHTAFRAGTVSAGELTLFESRLSPQGARYIAVARAGFTADGS